MKDPYDPTFVPGEDAPTRSATGESSKSSKARGEAPGDVIDRYKLLEKLGEGGMGSVWMAQQAEPVKRRVALKIIKLGMDTREVVARFEVERQALALMDHPHIAKVLDAGTTSSGRPYFVMELVRGVPITNYCDQAKLGLSERLELFHRVCHAIQHAHHKGIIHRDVKPSNILVSEQDNSALPKVIDFGIAKATSGELTDQTLYTMFSQVVGTPAYMAPEQAESNGLDIDTRADIYSLGVLLYELLTGTKPLEFKRADLAGYEEMLRMIREEDPAKPSTRISSLGQDADAIAGKRRVNTQSLHRHLQGDLDWIVMKALEKDRSRRYETANGFAEDIAHYLNDEPVDAAPPSARYRLNKLLQRRKKTVIFAATIASLLIAGSVGTGIGWWKTTKANKSLDRALAEKEFALGQEEMQRRLAQQNELRAQEEAERATQAEAATKARAEELEQVAAFQAEQLSKLDVDLMGIRMRAALLAAVPKTRRSALEQKLASVNFTNLALGTLRDNLFERTIATIDQQFETQPLVRAQLLQTTAITWRDLGLLETALDPQQRALALRRNELGAEHQATLDSLNATGNLYKDLGRFNEAELCYREALDVTRRIFGDDHPSTLASIGNMGLLLSDQGNFNEAVPYYRDALEGMRRVLGDEHPSTLLSINNMGLLLQSQGKLAEAEPISREALEGFRRVHGDEHPLTLRAANNLGILFQAQGRFAEAERFHLEALEASRRILGDEHPTTLTFLSNLGGISAAQKKFSSAEAYCGEAVEGLRRVLGNDHPSTLNAISSMGYIFQVQGKLTEAERCYREALESFNRAGGAEHPNTLTLTDNLASLLEAQGKYGAAKLLFGQALAVRRRVDGDTNAATLASIDNFENLLRSLWDAAREDGGKLEQGQAGASLGAFLITVNQHAEAEEILAQALPLLFSQSKENSPAAFQAQTNLALALAGQGRFEEADVILLESTQWLIEHEILLDQLEDYGSPSSAADVLQTRIDFYTAWHNAQPGQGFDAQAASWQMELDALEAR